MSDIRLFGKTYGALRVKVGNAMYHGFKNSAKAKELLDDFEAAVDAKARADERERIAKAAEDKALQSDERGTLTVDDDVQRAYYRGEAEGMREVAFIARNGGSGDER